MFDVIKLFDCMSFLWLRITLLKRVLDISVRCEIILKDSIFSELIKSLDKKETMCEGLIYKIWAIELKFSIRKKNIKDILFDYAIEKIHFITYIILKQQNKSN